MAFLLLWSDIIFMQVFYLCLKHIDITVFPFINIAFIRSIAVISNMTHRALNRQHDPKPWQRRHRHIFVRIKRYYDPAPAVHTPVGMKVHCRLTVYGCNPYICHIMCLPVQTECIGMIYFGHCRIVACLFPLLLDLDVIVCGCTVNLISRMSPENRFSIFENAGRRSGLLPKGNTKCTA